MIALALFWALTQQPDLASRIAAAPDGEVRMTYTARPGLCEGHHRYVSGDDDTDVEYDEDCDDGPVRVVLWMSAHEITRIHVHVGGRWRPRAVTITDLGAVPASAAADYFVGLAERNATRGDFSGNSCRQRRPGPNLATFGRDRARRVEADGDAEERGLLARPGRGQLHGHTRFTGVR
jgi:hypothetical protein